MKKQREKKKQKKKEEKMQRKVERQENSTGGSLAEMIAYVDEFGNITDTPPEEQKETSPDEDQEKA
ncbi:cold-shock protein [Pontibacter oryzae]|nr:cold-shock protein [Pontibacter oryzae]